MEYKLEYLPSAASDILEIEAYLYEFNRSAADSFTDEIIKQTETLTKYPLMYKVYEEDDYFRSMLLSFGYRLFYHVINETKTIKIHRILHGMRDIKKEL